MASDSEFAPANFAIDFEDFDQDEAFHKAEFHVRSKESKNFIVEFGLKRARIAFDVNHDEMNELLDHNPDEHVDYPIRWMYVARYKYRVCCLLIKVQQHMGPQRAKGCYELYRQEVWVLAQVAWFDDYTKNTAG